MVRAGGHAAAWTLRALFIAATVYLSVRAVKVRDPVFLLLLVIASTTFIGCVFDALFENGGNWRYAIPVRPTWYLVVAAAVFSRPAGLPDEAA